MITVVSMNPSMDRTVEVERLHVGGLNRVAAQTDVAAGKGVNVALAIAALGGEASCVGLMCREGSARFEERLSRAGVGCAFVWQDGAMRVNLKLFDRAKGEITELNASGAPVGEEQLKAVRGLVRDRARGSDFLVLTGSLPPGVPEEFYATLARDASREGCRVILDADGERLRLGLAAKPFLVKPNRYELEQLTGRELRTMDALLDAAMELVRGGVRMAAVSLGSEGALITAGRAALRAPGLRVNVRSTVGAGDSMIAGLAVGFVCGATLEDAFRMGIGAAAARCAQPPEEALSLELARSFAGEVHLERLDAARG